MVSRWIRIHQISSVSCASIFNNLFLCAGRRRHVTGREGSRDGSEGAVIVGKNAPEHYVAALFAFLQLSEGYRKIVAICEAVLAEEIGVIAASRRLSALGLELFERRHEDFITFAAVHTETDHVPVDIERRNWSTEALKRKMRRSLKQKRSIKTV